MKNKCYICGKTSDTCTPWGVYVCNTCLTYISDENIRISNLHNKDRLQELHNNISELINLISSESLGDLPRFYSYLSIMKNNIEICINSDYRDMEELRELLKEDWNSCFNLHCGIPDWYIKRDIFEEQLKMNQILKNKTENIDKLMHFND